MDAIKLIEIKEDIQADNEEVAERLRKRLAEEKTLMINLMSSPGSGKTSLLLRTIEALKNEVRIGIIEADIDSLVDSETIAKTGVQSLQLRTGGFCHLDASMVTSGLDGLENPELDLVFVENVGNLVCPAEFDTGATLDAMILSVPEGDDKPLKYPLMFTKTNVLIVNKTDYMALSDFDMERLRERVKKLNPDIAIIAVSCKTGEGIEEWIGWLRKTIAAFRNRSL
ncbi:MAG TPA: hydrogenase nickel incorporation protein HypB [Desulfosalsimonadaceae bacterium]|nr:hydrogenase nickel incorporation protein HypB [Desulfosalsimonadaceae bacterium]